MTTMKNETVRDRFWAWAHAEGAYNDGLWGLENQTSRITPYEGAQYLGVSNVIFVRYYGIPQPPFEQYYTPMRMLNQVQWSITGASGQTSEEEREHVLHLAENSPNITGFMLDDFFYFTNKCKPKQHWLSKADRKFPVFVTVTLAKPVEASIVQVKQSEWDMGDFLTQDFAVDVLDVSAKEDDWRQVGTGTLPNESGVEKQITFSDAKIKAFRVRCLNAINRVGCGLRKVRLFASSQGQRVEIPLTDAKAEASSTYVGQYAQSVICNHIDIENAENCPAPASLTVNELRKIRDHFHNVIGRRMDLSVVCYDRNIHPRIRPHLELFDSIVFYTWFADDLEHLEENLSKLEQLVPGKRIRLGCYMWDFGGGKKPMPIEKMQKQCELGLKWLKQGRIEDMIFLATNLCDLNLETVEWTRRWIDKVGNEPLLSQ